MKRIILAALVGVLLLGGTAKAGERLFICSNMKGYSIYEKDAMSHTSGDNIKSVEDGYSGSKFFIAIDGKRATVQWKPFSITDNATVVKSSDAIISFVSSGDFGTRLFSLYKVGKRYIF